MAKRLGVVLVFQDHVTQEEADRIVQELCDSAIVDRRNSSEVHEFDNTHTGPVWYLP